MGTLSFALIMSSRHLLNNFQTVDTVLVSLATRKIRTFRVEKTICNMSRPTTKTRQNLRKTLTHHSNAHVFNCT